MNARERFLLYDERKTKQVVMFTDANLPRHYGLFVYNGAVYSSVYLYEPNFTCKYEWKGLHKQDFKKNLQLPVFLFGDSSQRHR